MPGTKIKVLNPKKLNKIDVDYIIIFAWRYAKQIIIEIKNYLVKKQNLLYHSRNIKF